MANHFNVEIKAKASAFSCAKEYLTTHADRFLGVDHQVDTYFMCDTGRFKLREGNIENSLIWYDREDKAGPKKSDIALYHVDQSRDLRGVLEKSNRVLTVVDKQRAIYFIENVKFHVDTVRGLGQFVEIEAINADNRFSEQQLLEQCQFYMKELKIDHRDLLDCSYSDLLMRKSGVVQKEITTYFEDFCKRLDRALGSISLGKKYIPDHVCFRVDSNKSYQKYKEDFASLGRLLTESETGGRLISTFQLNRPLEWAGHSIDVVELPAPKDSRPYQTGFEHMEFVIDSSFEDFAKMWAMDFDWSGTNKKHNPSYVGRLIQICHSSFTIKRSRM